MTALRGCPYCNGWMRWSQYSCNECNGTNTRESYQKRSANLFVCLYAAAVEEMRVRCAIARMREDSNEQP